MRFALATVVVRDVAAARDWYRDVLGFRVVSFSARWGWCELKQPRSGVGLALLEPKKEWGDFTPKVRKRLGTYTGLIFHVDDIDAEVERLERLGVEFTRKAKQELWGGLEALFRDPDGNEFHLVQPP